MYHRFIGYKAVTVYVSRDLIGSRAVTVFVTPSDFASHGDDAVGTRQRTSLTGTPWVTHELHYTPWVTN